MKRSFYLILLSFLLLLTGACSTTDDNNPSPVPDVRDKYIGQWNVNNEICGKGKYLVSIRKDPSNTAQVLLVNFAFSNNIEPDTAIVTSSSIVVYKQKNSEGWTVEGNGIYKNDESIAWNYMLTISGYQENCTCTYKKN